MAEDTEPQKPADQLSPNRALRESTGATGSQRVGNNSPVANPTVSFPDDPEAPDEPAVPAEPSAEKAQERETPGSA